MYTHNLDPVLFDLGFIAIRWYSLAYIVGILIGWWLGKRIIIKKIKTQCQRKLQERRRSSPQELANPETLDPPFSRSPQETSESVVISSQRRILPDSSSGQSM